MTIFEMLQVILHLKNKISWHGLNEK